MGSKSSKSKTKLYELQNKTKTIRKKIHGLNVSEEKNDHCCLFSHFFLSLVSLPLSDQNSDKQNICCIKNGFYLNDAPLEQFSNIQLLIVLSCNWTVDVEKYFLKEKNIIQKVCKKYLRFQFCIEVICAYYNY